MQEKKKGCFYIGGRCYSTDTAAVLCSYTGIFESVTLYVTPKRAFFTVEESEAFGDTVRVLLETEARQLMDEHAAGNVEEKKYHNLIVLRYITDTPVHAAHLCSPPNVPE